MVVKDFNEKLDKMIPDARCELNYNRDYELLIAVVLSAQCTDKTVNEVTSILFGNYAKEIYDFTLIGFPFSNITLPSLRYSSILGSNTTAYAPIPYSFLRLSLIIFSFVSFIYKLFSFNLSIVTPPKYIILNTFFTK